MLQASTDIKQLQMEDDLAWVWAIKVLSSSYTQIAKEQVLVAWWNMHTYALCEQLCL